MKIEPRRHRKKHIANNRRRTAGPGILVRLDSPNADFPEFLAALGVERLAE
jgi:hypothetical protein